MDVQWFRNLGELREEFEHAAKDMEAKQAELKTTTVALAKGTEEESESTKRKASHKGFGT